MPKQGVNNPLSLRVGYSQPDDGNPQWRENMTKGTAYAEALNTYIEAIGTKASGVVNPDRSNEGTLLCDIYTWQTIEKIAKAKHAAAWEAAQGEGGFVADDNPIRNLYVVGEHIVAESPCFTAMIELQAPRETFNKDEFIKRVCKKYKLSIADVSAMAETCKTKGKKPLSKRVLVV
jgi:hypothetical protein